MNCIFRRSGYPTLEPVSPTFADNSWETIIEAFQSGTMPDTWVVGNNKTTTLGGADYQIDIIGKSHDAYTAGGTAPLTPMIHDCLPTKYAMNITNTNVGSWRASNMRTSIVPIIIAMFPATVQSAMR